MTYRGRGPEDIFTRPAKDYGHEENAGRLFGTYGATVVDINDPEKLGRIKVRYHWLEREGIKMSSEWVHQNTPWAGPTDLRRKRKFGISFPSPEVGSPVHIVFIDGDPHAPVYIGQPRHGEGNYAIPELEKDKHIDWSWRYDYPNGTSIGGGTDGDTYFLVNGNLTIKCQGSMKLTARGHLAMYATNILQGALSVIKRIAATIVDKRADAATDEPEYWQNMAEMMDGRPGYKDPGINGPEDVE